MYVTALHGRLPPVAVKVDWIGVRAAGDLNDRAA